MPSDESINNGDNNESAKGAHKDEKGRDICRDYLNNICNRGSRCKFYHPDEHDGKSQNAADEPYQFCIDFQNQGCHRDNCRYVHAFREDVERYKRSGDVTLGLARALAALMRGDSINGIPLCKEFQNGHCARGSQCRYWHINRDEERRKRFAGRSCGGNGSPAVHPFGAYSGPPAAGMRRHADDYGMPFDDYGPPQKRGSFVSPVTPGVPAPPTRVIVDLERRNAELVAEVESLRRELQREKERYDDLMALFRATQTNSMQQRPVTGQAPSAGTAQPLQSIPTKLDFTGMQQQQPQPMQQQPMQQQHWNTGTTPSYSVGGWGT